METFRKATDFWRLMFDAYAVMPNNFNTDCLTFPHITLVLLHFIEKFSVFVDNETFQILMHFITQMNILICLCYAKLCLYTFLDYQSVRSRLSIQKFYLVSANVR